MIKLIVAIDNKNGFAKNNKIPWHYREDFQYFKNVTSNHCCLMGRNTYNEINELIGKPDNNILMPTRQSFVLSTTLSFLHNAIVVDSVDECIECVNNDADFIGKDVFIIGGQQLYTIGLEKADEIYVTHINKDYDCDMFFDMEYVYYHFPNERTLPSTNNDLTFKIYTK